jgi:DNA-directed RNA polymerase subunit RPC12/RpoP
MLEVWCRNCGHKFNIQEKHAHKNWACPKCKSLLDVPKAGGTVYFKCTTCRRDMEALDVSRGNLVECPGCGSFVEVPRANY